jgi:UDP-GlcNAc:undecaprenyl-phosphate GlcNAc-1-phosphate transferase
VSAAAAHLFLGVVAAAVAMAATPLVRRLALRLDAVDRPGPRRVHRATTPRLGGLAVLAGAGGAIAAAEAGGIPVVATLRAGGWQLGWLAAGIAVVTAAGAADDLRGLTPGAKLALESAAGGLALAGGYALHGFTHPLSGEFVALGVVAGSCVTLAWILLVTNALNLIDGLDGLAAGVALIASLALLVIAWSEGRVDATLLWVTLAGALAGFLVYNFNPASIFLGDSGSLLLGYLLAVLSLQSLQKGATTVVVLAPVLALGLPIADVMLTIARRTLASGVGSVWQADRGHIHHRLLGRGLSQRGAVLALYGVCTGLGALAFAAVLVQGVANAVVVAIAAAAVAVAVRRLGYDARGRRAHLAEDAAPPPARPADRSAPR